MAKNPRLKLEALVAQAKNTQSDFERTATNLIKGMDRDLATLEKQLREASKAIEKEEKRFSDAMDLEVLKLFKE